MFKAKANIPSLNDIIHQTHIMQYNAI